MLNYLVALLLAAIPALVLVVDSGGSAPLTLLGLVGIVIALKHKTWRLLHKDEFILLGIVLMFILVSALSVFAMGVTEAGLGKLDLHLRLIAIIPVYLLVRQVRPSVRVVWLGIVIGALGAGAVAAYQVTLGDMNRAIGANNAIHFGNISLILGFMSLLAIEQLPPLVRMLAPIAATMGVLASLLSGTRGSWLAIPVLLFIVLWHYRRSFGGRAAFATGAILLSLPILAYYLPATGVHDRIHHAEHELVEYYASEKRDSSIGIRLEMWKAAATVVMSHPFTGVGLGRYEEAVQPLVDQGVVTSEILRFQDAHSEYWSTLLTRGIPGFVILLTLLLYPLSLLRRGYQSGSAASAISGAGLIAVGGYIVHGVHNNVFERGLSLSFFAFVIGGLVALMYAEGAAARTEQNGSRRAGN